MHMQPLLQQRRDALGVLSIRTQAAREDFAEAERTVIEAARVMHGNQTRPAHRLREQHPDPGAFVKRITNQVHQRRRQTWLDLPVHGVHSGGRRRLAF